MKKVVQDKRELVKLSTAIKEYCGINVQEALTIQQMKETLEKSSVSISEGNSTVNNINTTTTITNSNHACLENPDNLVALASVIRNKAGIDQKLAVPQMEHLVKNFKKQTNKPFYAQIDVTYFDDYYYHNYMDYYLQFWDGTTRYPLEYYCGWSDYIDNISISGAGGNPGSTSTIWFEFNSRYVYDGPYIIYLYRNSDVIDTITININNETATATISQSPYNPDQGGGCCGGSCGGSCGGGSFDPNAWYSYKKNFGTINGDYGTAGSTSVTVEIWGQSLTLTSGENPCSPYYSEAYAYDGVCQYATISAYFTEPNIPEGSWIIEVEISAYGQYGTSTPVTIIGHSTSYTEDFICDCTTIY